MVERMHFVLHFRFPALPDAGRAVFHHVTPAGIRGIFQYIDDLVGIAVFGEHVKDVAVADIAARAVMAAPDRVAVNIFRNARTERFGHDAQRQRESVFRLRAAAVIKGLFVEIFCVQGGGATLGMIRTALRPPRCRRSRRGGASL